MSVYTPVSTEELEQFLTQYSVGSLQYYVGITAGIENSNFFVTTTGGDYVLTLFEHHTPAELGYFMAVLQHWAQADIPVAEPVCTRNRQVLNTLNGKPAALLTRLAGTHPEQPTAAECAQMGEILARMHVAGETFPLKRPPDRGHDWRMQTAEHVLPHLDFEDAALLKREMAFQQTLTLDQLPSGTIHADLFRDNALLVDGKLSGVLDVYFACTDSLLYDLAVLVNDWCGQADGALQTDKLEACIGAYQTVRPWTALEQHYWPALLRAAVLRFWLSRLVAKLNPREGEIAWQKDPTEFRNKLLWLHKTYA